jgi:NAD(P)H-hydrate epimerase
MIIGVFIHGYAGDISKEELGEESLIASDLIDNLPKSFKKIID